MNDWKALLNRQSATSAESIALHADKAEMEIAEAPDPLQYRPWITQRGEGRPALFIDFRRYEPKTGLLIGQLMSYPQLISIDYIGDTMVSLDFGSRQYVVEGVQLNDLPRLLQSGAVWAIQEFSRKVWSNQSEGPIVSRISRLETPPQNETEYN